MKKVVTLCILLLLVLIGCESTSEDNDPPPPSGDTCTNVLSGVINLPTTLVDTPSTCDYLLEGDLRVTSTLIIEPGVRVVATRSSSITVEGADLIAVGTADKRIVFEGQEPLQGYWGGVALEDARPSRIEYVDIKDGGQSDRQASAGLFLRDVVVSLTNSSVSNSFVDGVYIDNDVELTSFANNRLYGNAFSGLFIDEATVIPNLDKASDYLGLERPNGRPYINLQRVFLSTFSTSEISWNKLNAPYYISSVMELSNVVLTLEPGTELIFEGEGRTFDAHFVSSGGLIAEGTAAEPIIFRGAEPGLDAWLGLEFASVTESVLKHVEIRDARRAIYLSANFYSSLRLSESSITNALDGIVCNTTLNDKLIELGSNVVFDVEDEPIGEACTVERF